MISLQEYQHVHLLWFKKRSFILVWKPNPTLHSVRCVHLRTRADAASESTMGACCSRSAYAPLLRCLCSRVRCETRLYWSARAESASLHVISEIFLLQQRRPCTHTSVTKSNFYSHTLKKWSHFGRSLEPWTAILIVIFHNNTVLLSWLPYDFFQKHVKSFQFPFMWFYYYQSVLK